MPNIKPTKQAQALIEALKKKGLEVIPEYWDGHKHVDIFVPCANLYLEIDGIQHYTNPKQFMADLTRDHYSSDGKFFTKHISNQLIETHLEEIAQTIKLVTESKK